MESITAGSGPPFTDRSAAHAMSVSARNAARELGLAFEYEFADPGIVQLALTHRSAGSTNNERLEFLGDSALGLAIAELVYARGPDASEGDLTRARAALVRKESLAGLARELGVGRYLVLGAGERKSGGKDRDSILANALEALFGALFIDGGYGAVLRVAERVFANRLACIANSGATKDPKTRLQELLQARGLAPPRYRIVGSSGAEHRPSFVVECDVGIAEHGSTRGKGASRRQAEQRAAQRALDSLNGADLHR